MNPITWYVVVMVLLSNILWTIATPKVDLNDLDNQEIAQKRKLSGGLKALGRLLTQGPNKFQLSSFVDFSPMASQDPNIAVSAYGTPPNNIIYGTLFDKSEHIPKMVIHVLYPVGVSKRPGYKDIKGVSWKKDKQLVDLNGKTLVKNQASLADYAKKNQKDIPGFMENTQYYAKGHFAPRGDFRTVDEQRLTYLFTNAAPMSQSLNNGIWKKLEGVLRSYSDKYQKELIIITLCAGEMLDYSTVPPKPLKLNDRITVPKRFAKVVIDPYAKESVIVYTGENELKPKELHNLYIEYDLTSKKINQMFPELNEYLDWYDCDPSGIPSQMIEDIQQLPPKLNIFVKPKI